MMEPNINRDFTVHPRKRMQPAPRYNWAGEPMPYRLDQVYTRYSGAKLAAYNDCIELCKCYNGYNFVITSFNTFAFSVAFDFEHPETGQMMTARITRCNADAYYIS